MKFKREKTFSEKLDNLLSRDSIRLQKLMEITQYCVFYIFVSAILAKIAKIVLPDITVDEVKEWSNLQLLVMIIFYSGIFCSLIYYTRKIVLLIPFFKITESYKPNLRSEATLLTLTMSGRTITTLFTQFTICLNEILNRFGKIDNSIIRKLLYDQK